MINFANSINIKKIGLIVCLIFYIIFISYSENNKDWVLSASKFEMIDVPELYASYQTIVPQLFLYNLNSDAHRVIPLSEQKARALLKLGNKKLKLIKELNKLILEKDKVFLSFETNQNKNRKIKTLNKKIQKKEEDIFFAQSNMKIEDLKFFFSDKSKPIVPWEGGNKLFELPNNSNLIESLASQNIDAVIMGSIKDISGYAYISVRLETGLPGIEVIEFYEAGKYENINEIVKSLSAQIYSTIQNIPEVMIYFDVSPKTASVFINEVKVNNFSKPVKVQNGKIKIYSYAEGYKSSIKEVELDGYDAYKLQIKLKEDKFFGVNFDVYNMKPEVYFKAKYYGLTPVELEIPSKKNVLEFVSDDVKTFVIFDTNKFSKEEELTYATAKLNKEATSKKIERRRRAMYWSLGAFYISLPATLILNGVTNDKIFAIKNGSLPATPKNINEARNLYIASNVMIGVSSSLAINYFIHVILYLVAADQTLPVEAKYMPVPMQKK